MQAFMAKYRIAWLPGDGIGMEVPACSNGRPGIPHQLRNCPSPTSPKQQYERCPDYF
jgi:hypothetical protein